MNFRNLDALQSACLEEVVEVDSLQEDLEKVHKDLFQGNEERRIRGQKLNNMKKCTPT